MGALPPQRAPNSYIAMCTTLMNMERSNSSFRYTKIESFLKLKEEYLVYVGAKGELERSIFIRGVLLSSVTNSLFKLISLGLFIINRGKSK